jgi:hypothetical protein
METDLEARVADYILPLYIPLKSKKRDYGEYPNQTDQMPWNVKDIPFKELSRGLCGYCEVLSTKAIAIGSWLKKDMSELARTLFHEELHKNGILDEYRVWAMENDAFMPSMSPYYKPRNY